MCHHLLIFDQSPKSKTVAYCVGLPCLIQEPVLQHGDHVGQAVCNSHYNCMPDLGK